MPELSFKEADAVWYLDVNGIIRAKENGIKKVKDAPCGSKDSKGYLQLNLKGKTYRYHRIAWMLFNKQDIPVDSKGKPLSVDHKDSDKENNRGVNLRACTHSENMQNSRKFKGSSKYKGVYFDRSNNKWKAQIFVNSKVKHLGHFTDEKEAHLAWVKAAKELHGNFYRGSNLIIKDIKMTTSKTTASTEIKSGFMAPDGQWFATKGEAVDHLRKPLVRAELMKVSDNQAELVDWLIANEEKLADAYDTGTIRRVSKQEAKALKSALEYIAEKMAGDVKAKFVVENATAIQETFKWPGQKRIAPEDKAAAVETAFLELTGDDAELTKWLIASKEQLDVAFSAGVVKREVSQLTLDKLAEARAKMAADREAAKAAQAKAAK